MCPPKLGDVPLTRLLGHKWLCCPHYKFRICLNEASALTFWGTCACAVVEVGNREITQQTSPFRVVSASKNDTFVQGVPPGAKLTEAKGI